MKIQELRMKSKNELKELVIQSRRELLNLRFQRTAGKTFSTSQFRTIKRNIARIKTLVRYQQINEEKM